METNKTDSSSNRLSGSPFNEKNPLVRFMLKLPGGLFMVPVLVGAIINSILILINITDSYKEVISTATIGLFALQMISAGTQVTFRGTTKLLGRGLVLLIVKFAGGFLAGFLVGKFFGPAGFLGISTLACISALTNSNGTMFFSLICQYGKTEEGMMQAVLGFNDGPFLTMIAMTAAGLASIPFSGIILAISPLFVGILLGAVWPKCKPVMRRVFGVACMVYAFSLGFNIYLPDAAKDILGGIVLAVCCIVFTGIPLVLADKIINRQRGYAGAAVASIAGNSVATPLLIATADPSWAPYVERATTVVSAAVIVGLIFTPIFTDLVAKKFGCPRFDLLKQQTAGTQAVNEQIQLSAKMKRKRSNNNEKSDQTESM